MSNHVLTVLTKPPILGTVKTRIAKDTNNQTALDIYIKLLSKAQDLCREILADVWVYYASESIPNDEWSTITNHRLLQAEGDLGDKLKDVSNTLAQQYDKYIIIGGDCPYISKSHIDDAFRALDKQDIVLGPVYDGGYYLIGAKNYYPAVFEQIDWSTEHVLDQTIDQIEKLELSFGLLDTLEDIDYIEDWKRYLDFYEASK